ncbi:hypothetical protein GQ53DRAFT_819497 [Thozetella sp. PMI_491]|nr:hypothetical protein GQ53DRAFT_819497 [Thozetella sp. PMI_491]
MGLFSPYQPIIDLCQPLLELRNDKVQFYHASVKEFLTMAPSNGISNPATHISPSESHSMLATLCIRRLLERQYESIDTIGRYLHRNWNTKRVVHAKGDLNLNPGIPLEYAAKYWVLHLTALDAPDQAILGQTEQFLHRLNFAFWVEYVLSTFVNDLAQITSAKTRLEDWLRQLPDEKEKQIQLDDFFITVYKDLVDGFRLTRKDDAEREYLALMRLGRYYIDIGHTDKGIALREEVFEGLERLLGARHPLVLQAKNDLILSYMNVGRFRDARKSYKWLVRVQLERFWDQMIRFYTRRW